ncbi:hypothetical protein M8J76_014377 [Diaphorina citri]|nr:hypothetical protein M8J75_003959 [Diaphorina citri]KAI5741513.1 hypothetical protein M8J76_014377 [Diaphorina citri]
MHKFNVYIEKEKGQQCTRKNSNTSRSKCSTKSKSCKNGRKSERNLQCLCNMMPSDDQCEKPSYCCECEEIPEEETDSDQELFCVMKCKGTSGLYQVVCNKKQKKNGYEEGQDSCEDDEEEEDEYYSGYSDNAACQGSEDCFSIVVKKKKSNNNKGCNKKNERNCGKKKTYKLIPC